MAEELPFHLRSDCPVNAALDLFGDRWSLLIVRDIILDDKHRYSEFEAMAEGIPTNILANRLKRMVAAGILEKRAYWQRPLRYEYHLTDKGQDLEPILRELIRWGLKHIPGTGGKKGFKKN
jgi:DNA-binding HxlR family transcriptional regulator